MTDYYTVHRLSATQTAACAAVARPIRLRCCHANGPNSHRRNTAFNTAAFRLGQLIDATGLTATDIGDSRPRAAPDVGLPEPEARAASRSGMRAGQTLPARTSVGRYRSHRATRDPPVPFDIGRQLTVLYARITMRWSDSPCVDQQRPE